MTRYIYKCILCTLLAHLVNNVDVSCWHENLSFQKNGGEFANAICIVRKAQSYLMLQNKKVLHGQLQTLIEKGIFTSKWRYECVECLKKCDVKDARGKESCLKETHQAEFMEIDDSEISVHNFVEQTHRSFGRICANAYGSVPHQLLLFALRRYDIPEHWVSLFMKYYEGLWSISWSESAPSSWHHHLRGIFIGCIASIILLLSAINVIIEHFCSYRRWNL